MTGLTVQPGEAEDEARQCPLCKSRLGIKFGRKQAFIGCQSYPSCRYSQPLAVRGTSEASEVQGKALEPARHSPEIQHCSRIYSKFAQTRHRKPSSASNTCLCCHAILCILGERYKAGLSLLQIKSWVSIQRLAGRSA